MRRPCSISGLDPGPFNISAPNHVAFPSDASDALADQGITGFLETTWPSPRAPGARGSSDRRGGDSPPAFKTEGYQVDVTDSAGAAVDRIEGRRYDVIRSDLRMPDLDGVSPY